MLVGGAVLVLLGIERLVNAWARFHYGRFWPCGDDMERSCSQPLLLSPAHSALGWLFFGIAYALPGCVLLALGIQALRGRRRRLATVVQPGA